MLIDVRDAHRRICITTWNWQKKWKSWILDSINFLFLPLLAAPPQRPTLELKVTPWTDTSISHVDLCSFFSHIFGVFVESLISALFAQSGSFGGRPSLVMFLVLHICSIWLEWTECCSVGCWAFGIIFFVTQHWSVLLHNFDWVF